MGPGDKGVNLCFPDAALFGLRHFELGAKLLESCRNESSADAQLLDPCC